VKAGEQGEFAGLEHVTANIDRISPRTDFENWANERDQQSRNARSSKYVSDEVVGYEDLDDNGDWIDEPEYGYVWRPRYVVHDWAPYRDGRWVWVSPWGWTWVDNARWGFAPFHYGRWVYLSRGWCWVPGPRHLRAVYAPAFVGWVGSPGVSVSVSIGPGVGWFPLGPREVYVPCYHHSPRYIRYINASNTVIIDNRQITNVYVGRGASPSYRYWRDPHALTVVSREHFVGGAPVREHIIHVNDRELRDMQVHARAPAIAPTRASVLAGRSVTPVAARHIDREQIVARRVAVPRRVSFEDERRAIEANHGRPVDRSRLFTRNVTPSPAGRIEAQRSGDARVIAPNRSATSRDAVIQRGNDRRVGTWNADRRNNDTRVNQGSSASPSTRIDNTERPSGNSAGAVPRTPRENGEREYRNTPNRQDGRTESSRVDQSRFSTPSDSLSGRSPPPSRIPSQRFEPRDNLQSRPEIRQAQPTQRFEVQRSEPRIESRSDYSRPQTSRPETSRPEPRVDRSNDNRGSDRSDRADRNAGSRRDVRDR
jgi:hypothetical protein